MSPASNLLPKEIQLLPPFLRLLRWLRIRPPNPNKPPNRHLTKRNHRILKQSLGIRFIPIIKRKNKRNVEVTAHESLGIPFALDKSRIAACKQ